jgi:spore coat polysaccharide biosynthesis protein SpsF (cytidylyltransferase family)
MRTRAGIILQARYASTRLVGKALEPLAGRSVLEHCLRRLIKAGVARVVLATTGEPEDDALEAIAVRLGAGVFRGEIDDVLNRFADAARTFDLDPVIRATGDNPAVDIQAPGRVLAALRLTDADYVQEHGLPYGAAVEGMTARALFTAAARATDPYDREHVTPFIRNNPDLFALAGIDAPASLTRPSLRVTVDTPEDLAGLRELFVRTRMEDPSLAALIAASGSRARLYQAPLHSAAIRQEVA